MNSGSKQYLYSSKIERPRCQEKHLNCLSHSYTSLRVFMVAGKLDILPITFDVSVVE